MTFAEYLRRRKSYTESGQVLRQAIHGMPLEVQTAPEVYAWLRQQNASLVVREIMRRASKDFAQMMRARRAKAAAAAIVSGSS